MGFTISTVPSNYMPVVLTITPMRILARLVLNWTFLEIISRFCTTLFAIGCNYTPPSFPKRAILARGTKALGAFPTEEGATKMQTRSSSQNNTKWWWLLLLSLLEKSCSNCVWDSPVFAYLAAHSEWRCLRAVSFCRWWKTANIHAHLALLVWGAIPQYPRSFTPLNPFPPLFLLPFFQVSFFFPPSPLLFLFPLFFLFFFSFLLSSPCPLFPFFSPFFFSTFFCLLCVCIVVCMCMRIWPLFNRMVTTTKSMCVGQWQCQAYTN